MDLSGGYLTHIRGFLENNGHELAVIFASIVLLFLIFHIFSNMLRIVLKAGVIAGLLFLVFHGLKAEGDKPSASGQLLRTMLTHAEEVSGAIKDKLPDIQIRVEIKPHQLQYPSKSVAALEAEGRH